MAEMNAVVTLSLKDKLTSSIRKVVKVVDTLKREIKGVGDKSRQANIGKPFDDARKKSEHLRNEITRLKTSLSTLKGHAQTLFGRAGIAGMIFGGVKATALAAGIPMVATAAMFEKYSMILKRNTKSKADYEAAKAEILKYEAATPYNLEEVTMAYVKLKQAKINPMSSGILQAAGDAAAANGTDLMQAIEAIMDARTKEFERLKAYQITTSQSKGKATFSYTGEDGQQKELTANLNNQLELTQAIQKIWNEKFKGTTDDLAKGWGGITSSLESMGQKFQLMVMDSGPFARFKTMLENILTQLQTWESDGTLKRFAEVVGQYISDTFDQLVPIVKAAWDGLKGVAEAIDKVATAVGGYKNLGYFALGLWLMVPALKAIVAAKEAYAILAGIEAVALGGAAGGLLKLAGGITAIVAALLALEQISPTIFDKLENLRPVTDQPRQSLQEQFGNDPNQMITGKIGGAAGKVINEHIKSWFNRPLARSPWNNKSKNDGRDGARAFGGSMYSGGTYLTGERGPELITAKRFGAVTPLGKLGKGKGDVTVNVTGNNFYGSKGSNPAKTIADDVLKALRGALHDGVYVQ
jgi:phage tail tape-measure protein